MTRSSLLRVVVTAAILIYLASRIDMGAALASVVRVEPWHLAFVVALVAIDRVVMIWRWVALLRASHENVPLWTAARIYLVSSFVGSFLPSGVGADAARAYGWARQTSEGSEAVASVAVDRVLGLLSIVGLGAFGSMLWVGRVDPALRQSVLWLSGLVILGAAAFWWADVALRRTLPGAWLGRGGGARLLGLADALARYRNRPGVIVHVLALSLLVQALRVIQAYWLGRGLGIDVPFGYYLVFMPVGLLMLLLPLSISGFGLPQGVIVWLLRPMGVPDERSFALSTLIVLTGIAGNLPGAWLYARGKKA